MQAVLSPLCHYGGETNTLFFMLFFFPPTFQMPNPKLISLLFYSLSKLYIPFTSFITKPSSSITEISLPIWAAMGSSLMPISPRKLRSDLYSYSYGDDSNVPLVISVLTSLIERSMARNERKIGNCKRVLSRDNITRVFDCHETPDMTIQSYLERIFRYTRTGPSVFVIAYIYIDRFCQIYDGFGINSANVHRLLITTIMVASKYVEDM